MPSIFKYLEPLKNKIILMITKAIITYVKDSELIQLVQIDMGNDEKIDSVERVQNFGFTSFPTSGAKAVVLFVSGEREHPIVVVADDNGDNRPSLVEGESSVYNAFNMIVKLKNGTIEIGENTFKKLINESFQTMFNNHVHNVAITIGALGTPTPHITGTPANITGSGGISPGAPGAALPGVSIGNSEMTSILKAE